ncbi:flagellar hook-basal body complex protein FliE [Halarcobacter ebronensis]|uniref:Flagellar hook-basal body complex protein FliE n=1 Tax=Halarcobacter ebronensis TaxID=1462615 RepID=A0A4Q0YG39_9BACT|nr:flagellar hook-basal body complex protein FliE [Halarcobacter ebronensis]RXJ69596.1 flagellar hook-basal body complex protein FliE [Halarcobacter ebronensis]
MNSISPIGVSSINSLLNNQSNNQTNKTDDKSFSELLNNAITEVNDTQVDAYNAMEGIATGKVKNLQEAVQKIEEADLSLKLALEVKNKALAAYKEIKSMQI